ncbi:hypothetical protein STREPTOSP366_46710 [Streptomyces variabilis]
MAWIEGMRLCGLLHWGSLEHWREHSEAQSFKVGQFDGRCGTKKPLM